MESNDTTDFTIGGPVYYFDGLIDEVRIYNRALSDEEVRALYLSSPIFYMSFDNPVLGDMKDDWSVI